jgi:hypothetical protein
MAVAWLQKTNFDRKKPAHLKVAHCLDSLMLLEAKAHQLLANESIQGEHNPLTASLSCDTHLSAVDHTTLLHCNIKRHQG